MIVVMLVVIILTLLYVKITKAQRYWMERGIKHRKPVFLFGDSMNSILMKRSVYTMLRELYCDFPNERYTGIYQLTQPILVVRDPELIKSITVKDFDHFVDHRPFLPEVTEFVWSKSIFFLRGTEWKHMRAAVSPTFTASKMKSIFCTVRDCVDVYMDYFLKKNGTIDIELKDTFSRYTNDVIASVAYGVECDSINNKQNEFYVMGKRVTTFNFTGNMKALAYTLAPSLCKFSGLRVFDMKGTQFLNGIMSETITMREKNGIKRPDMISLLLDEKKQRDASIDNQSGKAEITDADIAAQALIFFFAGFETVSTLLTFMAYELTVNPDVQSKLQKEIDEVLDECNGKLQYDALVKMKYMDMVISETLRLWPPAVGGDRECTKPYTIQPTTSTEKKLELKPGDMLWIPYHALHIDPKYFPDPLKFDPERFSDENKGSIQPYTYMPFGMGPRICIGVRLAQMEVKALIFNMLSKFDFVRNGNTQVPVKVSKVSFHLKPADELWITLKPRQ